MQSSRELDVYASTNQINEGYHRRFHYKVMAVAGTFVRNSIDLCMILTIVQAPASSQVPTTYSA